MVSARVWTWLVLCFWLGGCELIADFDRGKLNADSGADNQEDSGVAE
jgi:hypothetical protein